VGAPIPYYAMSAQRYMHEYGVTAEAIAEVPVRLRVHAADHPLAQFRKPLTVEEVLSSPVLSPPIHLPEAASVSTGAAAAVVTRASRARETHRVRIAGWGEFHDPSHFISPSAPLTRFVSMERAAADAFAEAGMMPGDVDVAEIYGVFAATELVAYESLGFFEKGEAARAVAEGRTTWGGDVVMNPTGGRLSLGHPAGATPLYEVAEIVRQLRAKAWGRQVEGAGVGLAQAEHGMMNGAAVVILERS
ncbi:MAG: thiolase family protein, partial [Myxococcales bacterium]|nr:thiolase family protein [Myxococcales bacterium]